LNCSSKIGLKYKENAANEWRHNNKDRTMTLTKNFSLQEFNSKDGSPMPKEVFENIILLANNLQVLRDELKASIKINSGYRSPAHNKKIGGAKNSTHTLGMAADIVVSGYSPKQVADTIDRLVKEGKMMTGGLKAYPTFTHYDIRGVKKRW
jgi:uncharacterized protein YcbK (DUF882 family)